jgi:hypothetical protein
VDRVISVNRYLHYFTLPQTNPRFFFKIGGREDEIMEIDDHRYHLGHRQ